MIPLFIFIDRLEPSVQFSTVQLETNLFLNMNHFDNFEKRRNFISIFFMPAIFFIVLTSRIEGMLG